MIIPVVQYGAGSARNLPLYDCTGVSPQFFKDSDGNWELVFTGNFTVTFRRLRTPVDIFLVAGGKQGSNGSGYLNAYNDCEAKGGAGGNGGGCVTRTNETLTVGTEYIGTIGASGLPTSFATFVASSGDGSSAGGGAKHYWKGTQVDSSAAGNGTAGVYAFGDSETLYQAGQKYGAGGAGGSAFSTLNNTPAAAGTGGVTGGGNGGSNSNGAAGLANTGGGGGGGSAYFRGDGQQNYAGGAGGSGIVIIRNAREST